MKKLIYLVILAAIGCVVVSEEIRHKVYRSLMVVKSGAERLVMRGNHLEVRVVDEDSFDSTIKEPGRLIIVSFQHELTSVAKMQSTAFDERMKDLPAKVLLAKVQKEKNEALLDRLGIEQIPTLRVYREGKLLREYEAPIDKEAFFEYVDYLLKYWAEKKI